MSAIVAKDLVKHFGPDIRAVDGIDLDIPEGQVFGFLGQNGSGKTTTVRMLTTLLRRTSGTVSVGGLDPQVEPNTVRKMIGVALQEVGLDELQTGRELLMLQASLFGIRGGDARKRVDDLLEVVTLTDAADRSIKGYSGGMKRRLDLACGLIHGPRIVFLDEPTTGLDPITRDAVWRYVQELNAQGVTFFLTTQYLEEADRLAHDIAIMHTGKIVAEGSPEALKTAIGADAIAISCPGGAPAIAEAEAILRGFAGVEDVRVIDEQVVVYIKNGAAAVAQIVRLFDDAELAIGELRLTHPTLDDVFLRITGRHLEADEQVQNPATGGAV